MKTPKKKVVKQPNKKEKVKDILSGIKKAHGEESIFIIGSAERKKIESLSTGIIGLDIATGIGGIPVGRVVEIFGPESSGKTTLALSCIAQAQKKNETCAFIDVEHALDFSFAEKIGVDLDKLAFSQPDSGEEALNIVEKLTASGEIKIIVVDSVSALIPKAEIEGDMEKHNVGGQARLMSKALRKLIGSASKTETTIIFINQIRMNIGMAFGNPETTSGGRALKFYSSVRLDVRRIQQIKKGDEVMGGRVKIKVVKNKVGVPYKVAEFDLLYSEGITKEGELLALGEKYGLIEKAGASYTYGEHKLGRGYDNARTTLKEDEELSSKLEAEIMKELNNN